MISTRLRLSKLLLSQFLFSVSFVVLSIVLASAAPAHAQKLPRYHVAKRIPIGGEGGWDYVSADPEAQRLYIAHTNHVEVIDLTQDRPYATIPRTEGVHGVAIARPFNHGFTSNGRANTVTMFDLESLDAIRIINVGNRPDGIVYDPASQHVFVINAASENLTVLDAESGNVLDSIAIGTAPEFAVADGKGHLYLNLEEANQIAKINTSTNKIETRFSLGSASGPTGIAMDRETNRLFSVTANRKMVVLDAETGRIIKTLPIGGHSDGVIFDPYRKVAISANGEGSITIVHEITPDKFAVVQTLKTEPGARTIALDTETHDLFTVTAKLGPTPAATADHPHPRPTILPGTFTLIRISAR